MEIIFGSHQTIYAPRLPKHRTIPYASDIARSGSRERDRGAVLKVHAAELLSQQTGRDGTGIRHVDTRAKTRASKTMARSTDGSDQ